jgi:hypothetical protein
MGPGPTSRPSPSEIFDKIDANHDGSVSRKEIEEFHEKMREQRREPGGPGGPGGPHGPTTRASAAD